MNKLTNGWMDGWTIAPADKWTNRWMVRDGWMERHNSLLGFIQEKLNKIV